MWVQSLCWEDPLEEGMEPTPVFLPEVSHGQRILVDYSPEGRNESDTTEATLLARAHTHTHTHTKCRGDTKNSQRQKHLNLKT